MVSSAFYSKMAYECMKNSVKTDIELIKLYQEGRRDFSDYSDYNILHIKKSKAGEYDIGKAELCHQYLRGIILNGSTLDYANLQGSDLRDAKLIGAILKFAQLQNTNFSGADLSDSDLCSGHLENANFSGAKLRSAILKFAQLQNTNLSGADLSGSDLSFGHLENANFSGAKLRGTNLKGIKLENTNFSGADLTDANLTGADLTGADLRRAKLQCANLRGANLKTSKIENTNFAEANFCDADLSQTYNKLTTVSTLKDAYYNDETKFPEGLHPTNVHKIAQKAAQKISQMIWSNYQDPQWIKELLNNKGEQQKYPPSREKQQEFKEELIKKYGYKCLISGCEIKEIIEAAHIIPYSKIESHDVANGLLLRVDLHRLFDAHLIAIHPITREVLISEQIAKDYQDIRGIKIESRLTGEDATKQQDALRYHSEQCNWIDKRLLE